MSLVVSAVLIIRNRVPLMSVSPRHFCELRHAAGLTQRQVAELCDVSQYAVRLWESGTWRPRPHLRPFLATALDVTVDELMASLERDGTNERRKE